MAKSLSYVNVKDRDVDVVEQLRVELHRVAGGEKDLGYCQWV